MKEKGPLWPSVPPLCLCGEAEPAAASRSAPASLTPRVRYGNENARPRGPGVIISSCRPPQDIALRASRRSRTWSCTAFTWRMWLLSTSLTALPAVSLRAFS